jgi:hypothetical protein
MKYRILVFMILIMYSASSEAYDYHGRRYRNSKIKLSMHNNYGVQGCAGDCGDLKPMIGMDFSFLWRVKYNVHIGPNLYVGFFSGEGDESSTTTLSTGMEMRNYWWVNRNFSINTLSGLGYTDYSKSTTDGSYNVKYEDDNGFYVALGFGLNLKILKFLSASLMVKFNINTWDNHGPLHNWFVGLGVSVFFENLR